jgi:hypothetical protein
MTTITHKRLVRAFIKAGCTVINMPRFGSEGKVSNRWMAKNVKDGRSVEWHVQAGFVPAKDGKESYFDETNLITTYVVERSPHTDIMTDCFCDSFHRTIRAAIHAIQ